MLLTLLCWFAIIFFFAATVRNLWTMQRSRCMVVRICTQSLGNRKKKLNTVDLILKTKNGGNSHAKRTMLAKSWIC